MLLLKSIILGFSVSAPVGPIGLLCIQRTLARGRAAGFLTGFGAVTANIFYASIAALGFSIVSAFLMQYEVYLKIAGTVFLIYLGVKTFLKKAPQNAAKLDGETLLTMYMSTFLLMITNPITILNFVAMFAGLGFDQQASSSRTAFALIIGVFIGATIWWGFLSYAVSKFRNKIMPHLEAVNKLAGVTIILLGVLSFLEF
jgi:threonine/homoserine/homoserine lactone efflux protein